MCICVRSGGGGGSLFLSTLTEKGMNINCCEYCDTICRYYIYKDLLDGIQEQKLVKQIDNKISLICDAGAGMITYFSYVERNEMQEMKKTEKHRC